MVASQYGDNADDAYDLITDANPNPILLTVPTTPSIDPITGKADPPTIPVNYQVYAIILPGPTNPNLTFEAMMMIRKNVRTLIVAAKGLPLLEIPPTANFTFMGSRWSCEGDTVLCPDGITPIIHTVIVKR